MKVQKFHHVSEEDLPECKRSQTLQAEESEDKTRRNCICDDDEFERELAALEAVRLHEKTWDAGPRHPDRLLACVIIVWLIIIVAVAVRYGAQW